MRKHIYTFLLLLIGLGTFAQTQPQYDALPSGTVPYGTQYYRSPDGRVWVGSSAGKFRIVTNKYSLDSLASAVTAQLNLKLNKTDTASLSNRINKRLSFSDTLNVIGTKTDVSNIVTFTISIPSVSGQQFVQDARLIGKVIKLISKGGLEYTVSASSSDALKNVSFDVANGRITFPENLVEGESIKVQYSLAGGSDVDISGVTTKDEFLSVFDNQVTPKTLFDGNIDVGLNQYISQSVGGNWLSGNVCAFIPVTAGHTIRISGRTGMPALLDNVWMNGNNTTVGTLPNYLNGSWGTSRFSGDVDIVVPNGATYLYCYYTPQFKVKIVDISDADVLYVLKSESLPNNLDQRINDIDDELSTINTQLANTATKNQGKIISTKKTYVAVGRQWNGYLDSYTTIPDGIKDYVLTGQSANSLIKRRINSIQYSPVTSSSDITVSYTLRDYNFGTTTGAMELKSKTIKTVPTTGGSGTVRVLVIGDSFVEIGAWNAEMFRLLDIDGDFNIVQVGTRSTTVNGLTTYHEGRSGWTWSNYVNDNSIGARNNAFRNNGVLDFANYRTQINLATGNPIGGYDIVIINLGVNDFGFTNSVISDSNGIPNVITQAKTFMSALLADQPSCKIIINLPTVGSYRFNDAINVQDYRTFNIARGARKYIDEFDEFRWRNNVYVCDASQWIDRDAGYVKTSVSSSSRLSLTEQSYVDPVHPGSTTGFYQMADGVYSTLRGILLGL